MNKHSSKYMNLLWSCVAVMTMGWASGCELEIVEEPVPDAGRADAGPNTSEHSDGGHDAGHVDAGDVDAGQVDAGQIDAGPTAVPDAGTLCDGIACQTNATCAVVNGAGVCRCHAGYQDNDNNGSCTATCATANVSCGANASCSDATGAALCGCNAGYQDNDNNGSCTATCATANVSCAANSTCADSTGTAACRCNAGYQDNDNNGSCAATCATANVSCGANASCSDATGAALCGCNAGYQDNDNNGSCTATCATANLSCAANSACADSTGTAACRCNAGSQDNDNNGSCTATCATANLSCSANSACADSTGTAACRCNAGYQDNDNNGSCTATCATANLSCAANSACADSTGTAACRCNAGYQDNDNNGSCTATCATANLSCAANSACADSTGTAACRCNAGYQDNDNNGSCTATCATANVSCSANASCSDTTGAALCGCNAGYQDNDNNGSCSATCATANLSCGTSSTCADSTGTAACRCNAGYQDNDNNGSCTATCATANLSCTANSMCADSTGTAACRCNAGYQDNDNNGSCTATCATANLSCAANSACADSTGTAVCRCNAGYQDNDNNGTCLPNCTTAALTCSGHGSCVDSSGTAACSCNAGFAESNCSACVRYVKSNAAGSGSGTSWANAFTRLAPAVVAANAAVSGSSGTLTQCEVWVAEGTYYSYQSARSDTIALKSNTWIYGGFVGSESARASRDSTAHATMLSGKSSDGLNDVFHVFTASGVTNVVLDGFDVFGGNANNPYPDDRGAGLSSQNSSITLDHMTFRDSYGGASGALVSQNDTAFSVKNTTIKNNTTGQGGGGLFVGNSINVTLDAVTFQNNVAYQGGAMQMFASTSTVLTMKNSTILANRAGLGPALFLSGGTFTIDNSTIMLNSGSDGAGLYARNMASPAKISRSTIAYNYGGLGGAVFDDTYSTAASGLTLENNLIYGNIASGPGGAVNRSTTSLNPVSLVNCTLYGNRSLSNTRNAFSSESAPAFTVTNSIVTGHHAYGGSDFSSSFLPVFSYSVVDDATLGVGTNKNAAAAFVAAPLWYDRTVSTGTTTTLNVGNAVAYTSGQTLKLIGIGDRVITGIDVPSNVLTISPALPTASATNTIIANWGVSPATTTEDFRLQAASVALDAANGTVAPALDILNQPRVDQAGVSNAGTGAVPYVDIGAYERQ